MYKERNEKGKEAMRGMGRGKEKKAAGIDIQNKIGSHLSTVKSEVRFGSHCGG